MKLSALAIIVLALGVALGLAFRGTVFDAEATKPFPEEGKHYQLEVKDTLEPVKMKWRPVDISGCTKVALFIEMEPSGVIDRFQLWVGAYDAWNRVTPDYVATGSANALETRYQRYDNVVAPLATVAVNSRHDHYLESLDLYCLP